MAGNLQNAHAPARRAARAIFFAAGFAVACWAPLIPFVKDRIGADEAQLGFLILCLGIGSMIAMPISGIHVSRRGARSTVLVAGVIAGGLLPIICSVEHSWQLAMALFAFGCALGSLDVAMNVFGSQVEILERRPLLSGFHAFFSIGGFCGVGLMTLLLSSGVVPLSASLFGGAIAIAVIVVGARGVLAVSGEDPERFVWPRGIVVLLALLAAITFLVEGSILEWGALLLIQRELVGPTGAGVGFLVFSAAMVVARLSGDFIATVLGEFRLLFFSGLLAIFGLILALTSPYIQGALAGFVLIGLGAANVAPVLFSKAGKQKVMPVGLAVASITIFGYLGHLMGPAMIGLAAKETDVPMAFWLLVALMFVVPATASTVAGRRAILKRGIQ